MKLFKKPANPILSGLDILKARTNASRYTFETSRRVKKMRQPLPHIGKKQKMKIFEGKNCLNNVPLVA